MQKEKIIVKLHALDWTMGEVAFFYFTLSDIGRLKVEWGDGHTSHYHGKEIRAEHSYHSSAKKTGEPFKVIIECKDCTFKYFHTGCFDMAIDNVDFRESPSLETLESHRAQTPLVPRIVRDNIGFEQQHSARNAGLQLRRNAKPSDLQVRQPQDTRMLVLPQSA